MEKDKKETKITSIKQKRIEKKIKEEVDENSQDALKDLVERFTDDTLTGK